MLNFLVFLFLASLVAAFGTSFTVMMMARGKHRGGRFWIISIALILVSILPASFFQIPDFPQLPMLVSLLVVIGGLCGYLIPHKLKKIKEKIDPALFWLAAIFLAVSAIIFLRNSGLSEDGFVFNIEAAHFIFAGLTSLIIWMLFYMFPSRYMQWRRRI